MERAIYALCIQGGSVGHCGSHLEWMSIKVHTVYSWSSSVHRFERWNCFAWLGWKGTLVPALEKGA